MKPPALVLGAGGDFGVRLGAAMAIARHAAAVLAEPETTSTFIQLDPAHGILPSRPMEATQCNGRTD
jgi:hypothetical protein